MEIRKRKRPQFETCICVRDTGGGNLVQAIELAETIIWLKIRHNSLKDSFVVFLTSLWHFKQLSFLKQFRTHSLIGH
jgi:hypothetical protein